jgi:hypothetical protein
MTDPHIHEYDYEDGNPRVDYSVDGKDIPPLDEISFEQIPFEEEYMWLDDLLSTDYQVTNEELKDYEAARTSGNGEPLRHQELEEFGARREMQEELIKKELATSGQREGLDSHEATKQFKLYKLKYVSDSIRKMMALYESHRRYLYSISKGRQPPVGVEDKEVRYFTVFLYVYRLSIKHTQSELRRRYRRFWGCNSQTAQILQRQRAKEIDRHR